MENITAVTETGDKSSLNPQNTPHISPLRASYGMYSVRILKKIYRVITTPHCTLHLKNNAQDLRFVVLRCGSLPVSFNHICWEYFTDTVAIIRLFQCQYYTYSNPDDYRYVSWR